MDLPPYTTGTVSIDDGSTTLTFTGGVITNMVAQRGDRIYLNNQQPGVEIFARTDTTHCEIAVPWTSGDLVNVPFTIVPNYPARVGAAEQAENVDTLVSAFSVKGFPWFVPAAATEPDQSYGDEGQAAWQPSTKKQWHKEGGIWVFDGIFSAFGIPAPFDNSKTYSLFEVAASGGASYVWINETPGAGHAPPNVTYWQVLAERGPTGATGAGYGGTAADSRLIGINSKSFTIGTGFAYQAGMRVRATSAANTANWMEGIVTSYTGGVLTVQTDKIGGSGTYADWLLNAAGQPAPTLGGTSVTSLTLGTGTKAFVTQTTLAYQNGARLRAASASDPSKWMEGPVAYAFGSSALTMAADKFNGSGTVSDWNFNPAGEPGAGDLSSANNLSDLPNKATARSNLGLAINTDVQGYSALLAQLAAFAGSVNKMPAWGGAGAFNIFDLTAFARSILDDADGGAMFATMGAVQSISGSGLSIKFPGLGSIVIKAGLTAGGGNTNVVFPSAFPNTAVVALAGSYDAPSSSTEILSGNTASLTTTGFTLYPRYYNQAAVTLGVATQRFFWIAAGN